MLRWCGSLIVISVLLANVHNSSAQTISTFSPTSSSASASSNVKNIQTHTIAVGKVVTYVPILHRRYLKRLMAYRDGLQANSQYSPDSIEAAVNDVIGEKGYLINTEERKADLFGDREFQFFPSNHSVARAEYGTPCVPYELTNPGETGFWSGFQPVTEISNNVIKAPLKAFVE